MPIEIVSTTDSDEVVMAAKADAVATKDASASAGDKKTASPEGEADETKLSGASEAPDEDEADEELEHDESDDKDAAADDKPKKKLGGFQRRVNKLNKKLSAAEQQIEYWRQEALRHQTAKQGEPEEKAAEKKSEGKPKANDFEHHEDYVEALADWKVEQKLSAREQKQKETQIKSEFQVMQDEHNKRIEEFKEKTPDFDDLMEEFVDDMKGVIIPQAVDYAVLQSDVGPQLLYEFAKNRDEFDRICSLPAIQAAKEIGKLEARLQKDADTSSKKTSETKTSKAPPPIKPVGSTTAGAGKKTIYDPELSQREFEKMRAEQISRQTT